jgi:hypothetical protein
VPEELRGALGIRDDDDDDTAIQASDGEGDEEYVDTDLDGE